MIAFIKPIKAMNHHSYYHVRVLAYNCRPNSETGVLKCEFYFKNLKCIA